MAKKVKRPSREEAEDAVRTLLAWTGDDVKGFTKILGNQAKIHASVNKIKI